MCVQGVRRMSACKDVHAGMCMQDVRTSAAPRRLTIRSTRLRISRCAQHTITSTSQVLNRQRRTDVSSASSRRQRPLAFALKEEKGLLDRSVIVACLPQ